MDDEELATLFEQHRLHLRALAHRLLGSFADADDAVQDSWLRLRRADAARIDNLGGWLSTVTSRICLDRLRTRHARPETFLGRDDLVEERRITGVVQCPCVSRPPTATAPRRARRRGRSSHRRSGP